MIKYYFTLICLILIQGFALSQDAGISAHSSPIDGCDLAVNERVIVAIRNNSTPPFIPGGQITANYSINGGPTVQELVSAQISLGSVFNFTFFQRIDISACNQDFEVKVWINYAADTNPNNDTITWTIRNDCTIVPGQVEIDELVCYGQNSSQLVLNGWQHGTIADWVYSEDNGSSWTQIPNTSTTHIFNDLTVETQFAVNIEGGHCPDDKSGIATISIQPLPIPGVLDGPDSLCISTANGAVNISGNSMPILDWEYSTDNGITWTGTGGTSTTENFINLTQTTLYRVLIDGGVCPDVYSDTLEVHIEQVSDAGVLEQNQVICESESANLTLNSYVGAIQEWQTSSDGVTWNPVAPPTTANTYNTGPLSTSTYYRVEVKNGVCSADLSNAVLIEVDPHVEPGTISGGAAICASNATGTLTLTGNTGPVLNWESSVDEGTTWNNISNTTTSENYNSLSVTTWYRALVDGNSCPDAYSDTAYIIISPTTDAGIIHQDTIICEGDSLLLTLTNNIGEVIDWEESIDGATWNSLSVTDSSYLINSVDITKYYRVITKSGVCDEDTTSIVTITKIDLPIVDAGLDSMIVKGDTIQLQGSGGIIGVWYPGGKLSDSTVYNPLAYPNVTTTYTLTAINAEGCVNSDEVIITVDPGIPPIDVKNLMTPNEDGANDTWIIVGREAYPNVAVKVYNIYGQLVYENEDYQNDWAGEFKNKHLPSGTYWYIVELGGTDDILKGNLTILNDE